MLDFKQRIAEVSSYQVEAQQAAYLLAGGGRFLRISEAYSEHRPVFKPGIDDRKLCWVLCVIHLP